MKRFANHVTRLALAASCTLAPAALAEQNRVLSDTFSFSLGVIDNEIDGDVTIARSPLPATPVDIEDVLGIDTDETSAWLAFRWRFAERWAFNFHYDRFDQSGGAAVEEAFNLDGVVYPVGALIETDLRADAYVMDLSYNLWEGSNYQAGLGLGLHAFAIEVQAKGFLQLGEELDEFSATTDSLIAPVPNARLYGTYTFTDRTSITANAGWLSLNYEDFDGDFVYLAGYLEYRLTDRWGAGLGAQYTDIDLEHDSGGGDFERLDVNFTGVTAYISYSF